MKNFNQPIYIVGDTNHNWFDYETNIKVKNYLNIYFKKSLFPSYTDQQEYHVTMRQ